MYKDKKRINKNGYVVVEENNHHKTFDTGTGINGVYEHVLVAEDMLGRRLKEGEAVHHLDLNRSNNSPDNLLVMYNPSHGKLHAWMNKHTIIPNEKQEERIKLGCVRCKVCERPINFNDVYCSVSCSNSDHKGQKGQHRYDHPDKETLHHMVWSQPTTAVAEKLGVSDVAISKLCKNLGIEKPPRGYWAKVKAGKINQ
jgi:hypothetical protein